MNAEAAVPLLRAAQSCIVLIDQDFAVPDLNELAARQDILVATALELGVPIYLCQLTSVTGGIQEETRSLLSGVITLQRADLNPWSDPELRERIERSSRSKLILAGGDPEGSLVQGALSALADGYDVYVLFDQIGGLFSNPVSIVAARLIQAGVVPLTVRQLLLEWRASTT